MSWPAVIVFVGASISAAGALWIALSEKRRGLKAIAIFVGAFISAAGALWASGQQAQFERELRVKSDDIAASITGGDSFCYLWFVSGGGSPNEPILMLIHQGKYPLYDVQLDILDVEKGDQLRMPLTVEGVLAQAHTILNVGTMSPGQVRMSGRWHLPDGQGQRYQVDILARNGVVNQSIRLQRVNSHWKQATKVTRRQGDVVVSLLEKADPEFPRDNAGAIRW